MSYCISHIIGIRTGGVFAGPIDMHDLKEQILAVVREREESSQIEAALDYALSAELTGPKGSWIVMAGVFNYWAWPEASRFSAVLSERLGTEVIHTCLDEERGERWSQVFLAGRPIVEVPENPVSRVLRRML